MKVTVERIMALGPCEGWSRARIEEYFSGRESISVADILEDEDLEEDDRLWLGVALLNHSDRVHWACDCTERALESCREQDPSLWAALATARQYVDGQAGAEKLTSARAAARATANDANDARTSTKAAVEATARTAAWASSWTSARTAAKAAVETASKTAVETAASDARATEVEWQLERLREKLEE